MKLKWFVMVIAAILSLFVASLSLTASAVPVDDIGIHQASSADVDIAEILGRVMSTFLISFGVVIGVLVMIAAYLFVLVKRFRPPEGIELAGETISASMQIDQSGITVIPPGFKASVYMEPIGSLTVECECKPKAHDDPAAPDKDPE